MLPLSALSGRALVAAAGLVAFAPSAEARRRKPPQAFVLATLRDPFATDATTFGVGYDAAVVHPASGTADDFTGNIAIEANVGTDQLRKQIIAELQKQTAEHLAGQATPVSVSADRIPVTLP
jgi:hypothetical protein